MNKCLKVGISPCPNDTFIFGAWILGFIEDSNKLELQVNYLDIQKLNEAAMTKDYDVIKISASQAHRIHPHYQILEVGAALGEDCGPLLVSKTPRRTNPEKHWKIASPGKDTTAQLLFQSLFPECVHIEAICFSKIEEAVLNGEFDAGIIIHESRFTYREKGLELVADLGQLWQTINRLPIPLGVIAVKSELDDSIKQFIKAQIRESLSFAYAHYDELLPFIRSHAQEMAEEVIKAHIELYVNAYSSELGETGKSAILRLNSLENTDQTNRQSLFI